MTIHVLAEPDMLVLAEVIGSTLLLKAAMIVACVGAVLALFSRLSAATKAAAWNLAFVALLALPPIAMILPSWNPIASLRAPEKTSVVEWDQRELTLPVSDKQPVAGVRRVYVVMTELPAIGSAVAMACVAIWFLVTLLLIARVVSHHWIAGRLRRDATRATRRLRRLGEVCARDVGLRDPPGIVVSDRIRLPAALAWPVPTVILPPAAERWEGQRLSAVLAHEFAHLTRRDHLSHFIVEIARAIYWLNPLVHLAASRVSVERERACDDVVLRIGYSPGGYAGFLLDLARSVLVVPGTAASLAVARRSGLAERVQSILNATEDRSPSRRRFVWLIGLLTMLVLIPVATFDVFSQSPPSVGQLIERLRSNDVHVARRAAWSLGEREDPRAVDALVEQTRLGAPDVRLVAVWALGEIKDRRGSDALVEALSDEDPLVREMAALALGELERPDDARALVAAADRDAALRPAIAWALGEIDSDEARLARREIADNEVPENDEVWSGTLSPLSAESSRSIGEWFSLLRAEAPDDRTLAAWHLGLLGDPGAVDELLDTLRDSEPAVRAMAVWALDEINPSRM